jgi:hypothetical protein
MTEIATETTVIRDETTALVDPPVVRAYDRRTMTSKILIEVLLTQGKGVREGDGVRLGRDVDTTLFVCIGSESLAVERVTSVECKHEVVIATTHRNEQYVLGYEDVRALRIASSSNKSGIV